MKIAILTTKDQWFERYAKKLSKELKCTCLFSHIGIDSFDIVFILSYHKIIPQNILKKNKHNIVIHASNLPKGKGWAPLFWQVLEGKNEITFTMFEAGYGVDDGDIYMQKTLKLTGYELNSELREKQANLTIQMCKEFIQKYDLYKNPTPQSGDESFYLKRTSKDSKLDINKTIKEQFNLLRIVDNKEYPAFFEIDGNRYILKIELDKMGGAELIDFVDLNLDEKLEVLAFRNHEDTRIWMYNSEEITEYEHLKFINALKFHIDKQYLAVKKEDATIGVIDFIFNYKTQEVFFGLYTNPFDKIPGNGRILEEISIRYIFDVLKFKKLKLEVFQNNEKAINLYKKFNFNETDKKIIKNKKVVCMELKYEDRKMI